MIAYYLLFFALFLLASVDFFEIKFNKNSSFFLILFVSILLFLFAGLRWFDVPLVTFDGKWQIFDYSAYVYVYDNPVALGLNFFQDYIQASSFVQGMDPGYVYLSSLFKQYITSDANIFFLILSFCTICLFISGLWRNNIKHIIFIVLFIYLCRLYFQYNFIMMRQAIAMVISWWAIPYIVHEKFGRFLFCCCCAGLFHFTGFLFLVVYLLPKFRFSNKFLYWTIPILLIMGVTGITTNIILLILKIILSFIGLGDKISSYLLNETYSKGINPLNFVELAPFLYCAIKYRDEICKTPNGFFFFNLTILYTLFLLLTMNFMALTRISSYYIYSFLYIIDFTFARINNRNNKLILGSLLCLYFFMYGIRFVYSNFSAYGYNIFLFH